MQFRIGVCLVVFVSHLCMLQQLFAPARAFADTGTVVISQLQVAGSSSSSEEFVELLNNSDMAVSLAGWQMRYRAATTTNGTDCAKGWTTKATIGTGTIPARGHYLLASTGYLAPDKNFASGLSNTAGTIRIIGADGSQSDALAWGKSTSCGLGLPAQVPAAGQSLKRQSNHGDNASDFVVQNAPDPQASLITIAPAPDPAGNATGENAGTDPELEITELLIDPAAPLTDDKDEFIEIHNRGLEPAQIGGYSLKTGTHKYTLPNQVLAPDGYVIFTSGATTISLTNSGGVANLLDPDGNVIDTAGAWESAVSGASWALTDDAWHWTLTPTPGAENMYTPVPGMTGADGSSDFVAVQLNELLPDPAAPLTDAADEYIEIFNPTDADADLNGYTIKVGHDLSSKYVIKDLVVAAGDYAVIKSAQTKLALANDGSSVALYAPDGTQLGAAVVYGKAQTGAAWAHFDDGWAWTSEPTPAAENIAAAIAASSATKSSAAKSAKTKTAAAKKTAKPKAAAKAKTTKSSSPLVAGSTTTGGRWLLFILAALTIGYIIYEFRYDIRNYYFKLRGYPGSRPAPLPAAVGRGDGRAGERLGRG